MPKLIALSSSLVLAATLACATSSASTAADTPAPATVTAAPAAAAHTPAATQWIPDGTWTTTIARADVPAEMANDLAGTWSLTITGGHWVARQNGAEAASGEYHSIPDHQIHFPADDTGPMACHMDGVYRVAVDAMKLTYVKVRDECAGRAAVLTAHAYDMKM